jgi:flagellar hook-associated protein 2
VDLVVGSNTYHLDLTTSNNLTGLRDAINKAGAGANATILTIGSVNYLSVATSSPGATTLQLNDVPRDLITNTGAGSETSTRTYADSTTVPVSASGKVDLVAGSTTYHLDLTGNNNLTGLMNAINAAGVPGLAASITGSAGSYSLSLAGPGPGTLQLNDIPTQADLISKTNQGTNADFMLNNVHVTRSSNVVNDIVPGVSFTLQNTTTGSITLSLATDPSQLSNAFQTFVTGYNALVDQMKQQVGPSAGPLGGDVLIREIGDDTRQLTSYWNAGGSSIHSLSDLGVTFQDATTGHLTFSQSTFAGLSSTQVSDAFKFLGSSSSGFAALAANFTQLSDSATGMIQVQEDGYDTTNAQLTSQINTLNDRVKLVQNSMSAKLQAADALVAQLQSRQNLVNASVSSLNYVLYGKQTNSNGL